MLGRILRDPVANFRWEEFRVAVDTQDIQGPWEGCREAPHMDPKTRISFLASPCIPTGTLG